MSTREIVFSECESLGYHRVRAKMDAGGYNAQDRLFAAEWLGDKARADAEASKALVDEQTEIARSSAESARRSAVAAEQANSIAAKARTTASHSFWISILAIGATVVIGLLQVYAALI